MNLAAGRTWFLSLSGALRDWLVISRGREDVEGFLRWLRLALRWDSGERPTALELLMDPWLMKGLKPREKETGGSGGVPRISAFVLIFGQVSCIFLST